MQVRGIRGATTVNSNTEKDIKEAALELMNTILAENDVKIEDISSLFFTMTDDLDKVYPAKCIRDELDFKFVPMMCYSELRIENSLQKCLRVMLNVNTNKKQDEIKHIYLRGASTLRKDLNSK